MNSSKQSLQVESIDGLTLVLDDTKLIWSSSKEPNLDELAEKIKKHNYHGGNYYFMQSCRKEGRDTGMLRITSYSYHETETSKTMRLEGSYFCALVNNPVLGPQWMFSGLFGNQQKMPGETEYSTGLDLTNYVSMSDSKTHGKLDSREIISSAEELRPHVLSLHYFLHKLRINLKNIIPPPRGVTNNGTYSTQGCFSDFFFLRINNPKSTSEIFELQYLIKKVLLPHLNNEKFIETTSGIFKKKKTNEGVQEMISYLSGISLKTGEKLENQNLAQTEKKIQEVYIQLFDQKYKLSNQLGLGESVLENLKEIAQKHYKENKPSAANAFFKLILDNLPKKEAHLGHFVSLVIKSKMEMQAVNTNKNEVDQPSSGKTEVSANKNTLQGDLIKAINDFLNQKNPTQDSMTLFLDPNTTSNNTNMNSQKTKKELYADRFKPLLNKLKSIKDLSNKKDWEEVNDLIEKLMPDNTRGLSVNEKSHLLDMVKLLNKIQDSVEAQLSKLSNIAKK